jgi:hypothetical protein
MPCYDVRSKWGAEGTYDSGEEEISIMEKIGSEMGFQNATYEHPKASKPNFNGQGVNYRLSKVESSCNQAPRHEQQYIKDDAFFS